nr:hypothetical protein CFP56_78327 [Quercus suber]
MNHDLTHFNLSEDTVNVLGLLGLVVRMCLEVSTFLKSSDDSLRRPSWRLKANHALPLCSAADPSPSEFGQDAQDKGIICHPTVLRLRCAGFLVFGASYLGELSVL